MRMIFEFFKTKYYLLKFGMAIKYELITDSTNRKDAILNNREKLEYAAKTFCLDKEKKEGALKDFNYFFSKRCCDNILSVLDVGCGLGFYSLFFESKIKNVNYTGVENNKYLLELATKYINPKVNFVFGYADKLNFEDNKFDLVMSAGVLLYVKDIKKAIEEIKRVSKKYIILSRFPLVRFSPMFDLRQTVIHKKGNKEINYCTIYNRDEIENLFKESGLKILERDFSSEIFGVKDVDEKIVCHIYLLEKINKDV